MTHRENGTSKLSMTGMTSSGTLIVLFGMYSLYVRSRIRLLVTWEPIQGLSDLVAFSCRVVKIYGGRRSWCAPRVWCRVVLES